MKIEDPYQQSWDALSTPCACKLLCRHALAEVTSNNGWQASVGKAAGKSARLPFEIHGLQVLDRRCMQYLAVKGKARAVALQVGQKHRQGSIAK